MNSDKRVVSLVTVAVVMSTLSMVFSAGSYLEKTPLETETPVLKTSLSAAFDGRPTPSTPATVTLSGSVSNYGHYGAMVTINVTISDPNGSSLTKGLDLGWITPEGGSKTITSKYTWPTPYLNQNLTRIPLKLDYTVHAERPT